MAWIPLSLLIFLLVKILVFGFFAPVSLSYFAVWVGVGFWVWRYISNTIMEGANLFVKSRSWILGTNLPLSLFVFQSLTRTIIHFAFGFIAVLFVFVWAQVRIQFEWFYSLLGLFGLLLNLAWMQILLALICSRFRDFIHLTATIMQVMFFLTPILFVPEQLGSYAYLLNFNPFTHYIAIIRDPIVTGTFPLLSWAVVIGVGLIGWVTSLIALTKLREKVAFYL